MTTMSAAQQVLRGSYELDWHQIRVADAGAWFSAKFAGERVPCLEEILSLPGLDFELELKGFTREFLRAVLDPVELVSGIVLFHHLPSFS
jgi:glycerophosphoryl diester phosphodiesterase